MNIRPAGTDDVGALAALLAGLFAQEAEFRPCEATQRRGLEAVFERGPSARILLAEEAGHVVAMVTLLYVPSTALGCDVALLEDMVVHPRARGRGIGTALLDAAIGQCHGDGCARITLLTDGDNAAAQAFYQRAGFRRSAMVPFRWTADAHEREGSAESG